eukprot:scaffold16056_cov86-Cyclotella_meneghiniana.AAC.2
MKRLRPPTAPEATRQQSVDVIHLTDSSPHRSHKSSSVQKPWRLRLARTRAAQAGLALAAVAASLLLLLLMQPSSYCYSLRPSQRLILTASHLRSSDGELRLRIITHNLKLLHQEDNKATKYYSRPPLKSIVIFSHDGDDSTLDSIYQWKLQHQDIVDEVKLVPNDAINVDVSKWKSVLEYTQNSEVMLINDSFLLLRPIPELWECTGVCGLGWTGPRGDVTRHFQSYLRVLTACEVINYRRFYNRNSHSKNVQELIQTLEVNLSWASNVQAMYEYDGGHPDADGVQHRLLKSGYPAIKLKKFFETNDPWLEQKQNGEDTTTNRLSPSLDLNIYRSKNHDLNHLSDKELADHFAAFGWRENRVYSRLTLVMKPWLRKELAVLPHGGEVMNILDDYLMVLNRGNERKY